MSQSLVRRLARYIWVHEGPPPGLDDRAVEDLGEQVYYWQVPVVDRGIPTTLAAWMNEGEVRDIRTYAWVLSAIEHTRDEFDSSLWLGRSLYSFDDGIGFCFAGGLLSIHEDTLFGPSPVLAVPRAKARRRLEDCDLIGVQLERAALQAEAALSNVRFWREVLDRLRTGEPVDLDVSEWTGQDGARQDWRPRRWMRR